MGAWGADKKDADVVGFGRDVRTEQLAIRGLTQDTGNSVPLVGVLGDKVQIAHNVMTIEQADEWMSIARSVITLTKKIRAAKDPRQEQLPGTEAPATETVE